MKLRSLNRPEAAFWLFDRVSSMNFAVIASGSGSIEDASIRRAIDLASQRREMAGLTVQVQPDGQLEFVPTTSPVEMRAANGNWSDLLALHLTEPFAEGAPLWRVAIYRNANDWTLAITFHHSIADGRSGMRFLSDFLLDMDHAPRESLQKLPIMKDVFAEAVRTGGPPSQRKPQSLPWFSKRTTAPVPAIRSFTLDRNESQILIQSARENGVTVHGWMAAAQLISTNALFETQEARNLAISTPVDYRKYVGASDIDSLWFCISLITSTLTVQNNFIELARNLSLDIKEQLTNGQGIRFYDSLPEPAQLLSKPDGVKLFGVMMQRLPQASVLSNVGSIAPPDLTNLTLEGLCFTVHPTIAQPMFVTATTCRDQINFVLNYDSNRWPAAMADRFVNEFKRNLTLPRNGVLQSP